MVSSSIGRGSISERTLNPKGEYSHAQKTLRRFPGHSFPDQTITSPSTATITVNSGSATGTLAITDPSTNATTSVTVSGGPLATSYTLTGPTSDTIGFASGNFTVTPNGLYTGTITPSDSGAGGTFSPTSLTFSSSSVAQTFTYTPGVSESGSTTISTGASPSLTAPPSIVLLVGAGTSVPVTNANIYWSPYNWQLSASSTWMQSSPGGAYLKVAFQGSVLALGIDTTPESLGSVPLSNILVDTYIDGTTTPITRTLANVASSTLLITSGLSNASHYAVVYLAQTTALSSYDRWNIPAETLRITNLELGVGDSLLTLAGTPIQATSTRVLMYGDSITEGYNQTNDESAYSAVLAKTLGVEYAQIGYSTTTSRSHQNKGRIMRSRCRPVFSGEFDFSI